jgi:hypothetical protein
LFYFFYFLAISNDIMTVKEDLGGVDKVESYHSSLIQLSDSGNELILNRVVRHQMSERDGLGEEPG